MSDPEKPTPDDLAPASAHRQRWEDARTTEEALRRNLFAAREALITEGVARNAAEAKLAKVRALLQPWTPEEVRARVGDDGVPNWPALIAEALK